jgi:hypothetical protein
MKFDGDLYQVGVVVRNIEQGMARYRALLGLGPFWRLDTNYHGRYRNWRGTFANKNAFARWGDLYLEMIEPGLGEGNAKEWLETRGEGIFHVGYATDNLDQRPGGVEVCSSPLVHLMQMARPLLFTSIPSISLAILSNYRTVPWSRK